MHSFYVIAGGLLLLGIFAAFARALTGVHPTVRGRLLLAFVPVWLGCAAFNMWVGVSRAGYSVGDEFPIFLVVFMIPAGGAFWLWRRLVRNR